MQSVGWAGNTKADVKWVFTSAEAGRLLWEFNAKLDNYRFKHLVQNATQHSDSVIWIGIMLSHTLIIHHTIFGIFFLCPSATEYDWRYITIENWFNLEAIWLNVACNTLLVTGKGTASPWWYHFVSAKLIWSSHDLICGVSYILRQRTSSQTTNSGIPTLTQQASFSGHKVKLTTLSSNIQWPTSQRLNCVSVSESVIFSPMVYYWIIQETLIHVSSTRTLGPLADMCMTLSLYFVI